MAVREYTRGIATVKAMLDHADNRPVILDMSFITATCPYRYDEYLTEGENTALAGKAEEFFYDVSTLFNEYERVLRSPCFEAENTWHCGHIVRAKYEYGEDPENRKKPLFEALNSVITARYALNASTRPVSASHNGALVQHVSRLESIIKQLHVPSYSKKRIHPTAITQGREVFAHALSASYVTDVVLATAKSLHRNMFKHCLGSADFFKQYYEPARSLELACVHPEKPGGFDSITRD